MANRFIAGENVDEAVEAIRKLNQSGISATVDHLGENVSTPEEAQNATSMYLNILEKIQEAKINCNVSLKLTALGLDLNEALCRDNLEKILIRAATLNNFVRIDMESSAYTARTLNLFNNLFTSYKNVGIVIQAYLFRSEKDIAELTKLQATVRLCKGAYSEPTQLAFAKKKDVDENYIKLMKKLLLSGTHPGIATHDPHIIEEMMQFVRDNHIARDRFEFQMLYGINRELQDKIVAEGYNLRIYVPYGKKWYPYFMRRLAERPANLMFFLSSLIRG